MDHVIAFSQKKKHKQLSYETFLILEINDKEFTNNNLYFFETSLAAVLFPLADSPSHAIINLLMYVVGIDSITLTIMSVFGCIGIGDVVTITVNPL